MTFLRFVKKFYELFCRYQIQIVQVLCCVRT